MRRQLWLLRHFAGACGINIEARHQILGDTVPVLLKSGIAGDPPVVIQHASHLPRLQIRHHRIRHMPAGGVCHIGNLQCNVVIA